MSASTPANGPLAPIAATDCPLCGAPNDCAPAQSGSFDTPCWCASVTVSGCALAAVPEPLRNRACLCRRCATDPSADRASGVGLASMPDGA